MQRKFTDIKKVYKAVIDCELEITENGEIWRIGKRVWSKWLKETVTRKCLRVRAEHDTKNYFMIRTMYENIRYTMGAHRLVYFHFKGEIPEGLTINHKNGNKKDNHPDNLELMTDQEQSIHARTVLKKGLLDQDGEKNSQSKLTKEQVEEIISRRESGEPLKNIASDYNIKIQHVSRLAKKQRWKHLHTTEFPKTS